MIFYQKSGHFFAGVAVILLYHRHFRLSVCARECVREGKGRAGGVFGGMGYLFDFHFSFSRAEGIYYYRIDNNQSRSLVEFVHVIYIITLIN